MSKLFCITYAGIKCGFEHERLMYHLRVIDVDGKPEICVRDKEADAIYSLFYTRYNLYIKGWWLKLKNKSNIN